MNTAQSVFFKEECWFKHILIRYKVHEKDWVRRKARHYPLQKQKEEGERRRGQKKKYRNTKTQNMNNTESTKKMGEWGNVPGVSIICIFAKTICNE